MIFVLTQSFKEDYKQLQTTIQRKADKTLRLLDVSLRHPSLQVKKIQGTKNIYEMRVDIHYRMTFTLEGETVTLRAVGSHDKTLKNPL